MKPRGPGSRPPGRRPPGKPGKTGKTGGMAGKPSGGPQRGERPASPYRRERPASPSPYRASPYRQAPPRPAPAHTPDTPETPRFMPPAELPGVVLSGIDELEVTVEKLVAGGEGLARYQGLPIFVLRSTPGDRLRVRIVERRPDYGRAVIEEILAPGPGRRPDPVPELADWGGCDLMHIEDGLQSRLKAAAVLETLERMGKVTLPVPAAEILVATGDPWHYRLRTQLHTGVVDGLLRVGYHARGTNDLIPVTRCPLLVPELEALLLTLPTRLGADPPWRLDLAAGEAGTNQVSVAPLAGDLPHGEVSLTVAGLTYAYDARCFFQGHRGLLPQLVAATVGPWKGDAAYDLYGGAGLFTLALAQHYGRVVGVEGERISARYARTNARRNKLTNVEIAPQAVESWIAQLPAGAARVVVDPPRAGLSLAVRRVIIERRPERLTYVSCHPAALARDLRQLAPTYHLENLILLDMFPQTGHMEVVAQLVLR